MDWNSLAREDLIKLLEVYAKNWLAHDGSWFLAIEEKQGMEDAIRFDTKAWERFSVAEAKRIMKTFDIPEGGGLKALEKALGYRLYAAVNRQEASWEDGALWFRMIDCRVQSTRRRRNLSDFPCKSVGIVEYSQFARTIDPRIRTECIHCPPDPTRKAYCTWRFTMDESI